MVGAADLAGFNGWKHLPSDELGAKQGEIFSVHLERGSRPWNNAFGGGAVVVPDTGLLPEHTLPGGMKLTVLSPTPERLGRLRRDWDKEIRKLHKTPGNGEDFEEYLARSPTTETAIDKLAMTEFEADTKSPNGSSIALLAEYQGLRVLLGGDAFAPVLEASLGRLLAARGVPRLALDAFKLGHHGSRSNTSVELVRLVDCPRWLISTNGARFKHPDREAVARIVKYAGGRPTLCFNYRSKFNEFWDDPKRKEAHGYETVFPTSKNGGLVVSLP